MPTARRRRAAGSGRAGLVAALLLALPGLPGCATDEGAGGVEHPAEGAASHGGAAAHDSGGGHGHDAGPGSTTGGHGHAAVTSAVDLPTWTAMAGLSVPRDDFATAVVGDDIWVMGGMTGERGNRLTSVEVLDTVAGTWRDSDVALPEGLASLEAVAVGPRIYVFGGFDADSRPTRFSAVLDTRTGRWQRLPKLPHARYAHTVTLHEGRIHVVGGRGPDGPVEQIDVFDPVRRAWSTSRATMPAARDSHDTVSTADGLLVVGGWRGDGPTDRVDLLDPRSGRHRRLPALPVPMSRAGVAVADGRVWVALHTTSYVLDLARPTRWQEANPLTLSRHGLGFVAVDDAVYAIGGCAENPLRDVRTVDRLELG